MKKNRLAVMVLCLMVAASVVAWAKEKKPKTGPLTGTWECTARGGAQGDMPFTLYMEQTKDAITGSISSPMGGTEISAGAIKKNDIEIHIDTPQGNYQLTGRLKKGELSGKWSSDTESGTWTGRKQAPSGK